MNYRGRVMELDLGWSGAELRCMAAEIAAEADQDIARLETDLELARMTERERICSAIKATDDAASECGYMLDSDDCIAVARGELGPANYEDAARAGNGGGV